MADKKISALPPSTVPLAGTEVLPIVQSNTTTQVSVANLTAGRAVSASSIGLAVSGAAASTPLYVGNYTSSAGYATGATADTNTTFLGPFAASSALNGARIYAENYSGTSQAYLDLSNIGSKDYNKYSGFRLIGGVATASASTSESYLSIGPTYYSTGGASLGFTETMRLSHLGDATISNGNLVQGTAAKGVTTGGPFNLGLGTNNSTTQANLTTDGSLLLNTTSLPFLYSGASNAKGVASLNTNQGKCLAGNVSSVAATTGTADFDLSYFAMGFLVIDNELATDAAIRTVTTFSVFSRGGNNFTCTPIASADGTGGARSFTVTWTGTSTLRITNTSADICNISMAYFGI